MGNTGVARKNKEVSRGNSGVSRKNTEVSRGNTGISRKNTEVSRGNLITNYFSNTENSRNLLMLKAQNNHATSLDFMKL